MQFSSTILPGQATVLELIASNAPLTMRAVKTALLAIEDPLVNRSVAEVDALVKACFDSADYKEGQAAFREKRKPQFQGR